MNMEAKDVAEDLMRLSNFMVEEGQDRQAELYDMAAGFIRHYADEFNAWATTPPEPPSEEPCPACGEIEDGHFMGCPEDDEVGRLVDDAYELVKDRELGV